MSIAKPEDHKPAKGTPFKFKAGGKSYILPPATVGRTSLTGRDLRDATMGGDVGQLTYLFKVVEACGATAAAIDALYSLPQSEMVDVLNAWSDHGDGDGASLGESSR